jgi:CRP-like cAMP-binding protein
VTDALVFEISKDHIASLISRRPELAEQIARVVTARKLRNLEAVAAANSAATETEKISMTAQLVGRMLAFFGLKTKIASFTRLERVKEIEPS